MGELKKASFTSALYNLALYFSFVDEAFFLNLEFKQSDYDIHFERFELTRFNKDYMKFYHLQTFKYNRTTPVVNYTYAYSIDTGYDVEMIIQAYTFLSNEYRLYSIRFEVNWCEAFNKNYGGLGRFNKCGNFTGCPHRKGRVYHVCNWAREESQFPPLIPDGKYMLELQGMLHGAEVWVLHAFGIVDRPIKLPFEVTNKHG